MADEPQGGEPKTPPPPDPPAAVIPAAQAAPSGPVIQNTNDSGDSREEIVMETFHVSRRYKGPLPHPDALKGYEAVYPGFAKILLDDFVKEGNHRRKQEEKGMDAHVDDMREDKQQQGRGQWFGLSIAIIMIIGAITFAALGYPHSGAVLGGTTLISLVTIYVLGRVTKEKPDDDGEDDDDEEEPTQQPNRPTQPPSKPALP
jgi:uncharacterized membrane protein